MPDGILGEGIAYLIASAVEHPTADAAKVSDRRKSRAAVSRRNPSDGVIRPARVAQGRNQRAEVTPQRIDQLLRCRRTGRRSKRRIVSIVIAEIYQRSCSRGVGRRNTKRRRADLVAAGIEAKLENVVDPEC